MYFKEECVLCRYVERFYGLCVLVYHVMFGIERWVCWKPTLGKLKYTCPKEGVGVLRFFGCKSFQSQCFSSSSCILQPQGHSMSWWSCLRFSSYSCIVLKVDWYLVPWIMINFGSSFSRHLLATVLKATYWFPLLILACNKFRCNGCHRCSYTTTS